MNKILYLNSVYYKYSHFLLNISRRGLIAALCILFTFTSNAIIISNEDSKRESTSNFEKGSIKEFLITGKETYFANFKNLIFKSYFTATPILDKLSTLPESESTELTIANNSDNNDYGIITNSSLKLFEIFIPSFAPAAITTSSGI